MNDEPKSKPDTHIKNFLVDLGYEEGETFCRELLDRDEFSVAMLRQFVSGKMSRREMASEIASKICDEKLDADKLMLAYCKEPRTWLCVRSGTKGMIWPKAESAYSFLTKRSDKSGLVWYGPFGDGDERWYVVTTLVDHWVDMGRDNPPARFPMRWQVAVQVTPTFAALHWNNASTKEKSTAQSASQFPYWRYLDDIYRDLKDMLYGNWDPRSPNLMDLILWTVFDRYADDPHYNWVHKAVSSSYDDVALNASGMAQKKKADPGEGTKKELTAQGLQILTRRLAETAARAVDLSHDAVAIEKMDREILRMILRKWGTKSYEFELDEKGTEKGIARMRVYFGSRTGPHGQLSQESIQHVHAYAKYGGSTGALNFILGEMQASQEPPPDEDDPGYDPFEDDEVYEDEPDSFEDDDTGEDEQPEYDPDED